MKRINILYLVSMLAVGCAKQDTKVPVVESYNLDNTVLGSSDTLLVTASFSDDEALGQYRLQVQQAIVKAYAPWSRTVVGQLHGGADKLSLQLQVPDSANAGLYLAQLEVNDEAGNRSGEQVLSFTIQQTGQPTISISTPDLGGPVLISPGDTLGILGVVQDDMDLENVCVILDGIYEETFSLADTVITIWDFSELSVQGKWLVVPDSTPVGEYPLILLATDNDGHQTVHTALVTVVD